MMNLKSTTRSSVACRGLKENVAKLPDATGVKRISIPLLSHAFEPAPGKMASVTIFNYVAEKYQGKLCKSSAAEALEIYGEVVEDARANPGVHPNIDILIKIMEEGSSYEIEVERSS